MTVSDVRSALAGYVDDASVRFWLPKYCLRTEPTELFLIDTDQELVNNKNPKVDVHFALERKK